MCIATSISFHRFGRVGCLLGSGLISSTCLARFYLLALRVAEDGAFLTGHLVGTIAEGEG